MRPAATELKLKLEGPEKSARIRENSYVAGGTAHAVVK